MLVPLLLFWLLLLLTLQLPYSARDVRPRL